MPSVLEIEAHTALHKISLVNALFDCQMSESCPMQQPPRMERYPTKNILSCKISVVNGDQGGRSIVAQEPLGLWFRIQHGPQQK